MNDITVDLGRFVVALMLLWLPRGWLRAGPGIGRRRRHLPAHSWTHAPQDGTVLSARHAFSKLRNYLDLVRGAVGTFAIVGGYGIRSAAILKHNGAVQPFAIPLAVLTIAILTQSIRRDRRGFALSAPVFFVAGMMLAAPPALPGLCAFALAWALVPVLPNAVGFMTIQVMVFSLVGAVLGGLNPSVISIAVASFLPVVLSLLMRRPLMVLSPRTRSGRS